MSQPLITELYGMFCSDLTEHHVRVSHSHLNVMHWSHAVPLMWLELQSCSVSSPGVASLRVTAMTCPRDWLLLHHLCLYTEETAGGHSWHEALQLCADMQESIKEVLPVVTDTLVQARSSLVSVHSEEESTLLHDLVEELEDRNSSSFWLGGRRPAGTERWSWADGSR